MRTTLDLNDELLRAFKRRAADERTTTKALVETALRHLLAWPTPSRKYRCRWKTERGKLLAALTRFPPVHDDRTMVWKVYLSIKDC